MGFNDQIRQNKFEAKGSIFRPGVKNMSMSGKGVTYFRILPAYNNKDIIEIEGEKQINPLGWLPFVTEDGCFNDWGQVIFAVRFMGHGTYKDGTRTDIIVNETFRKSSNEHIECLYTLLRSYAASDPDWNYLIQNDIKTQKRAELPKPQKHMVANVIDINHQERGVQIGLFSTSAYNSLLNPAQNGLACQKASNIPEELIAKDYLLGWAVGDITNPKTGPILEISKGTDKGDMSGYRIILSQDMSGKVKRWEITPKELLAYRYYLPSLNEIVNGLSDEDMLQIFINALNQRSPKGYHEWSLLKEVFGSRFGNLIPEPPVKQASSRPAIAPEDNTNVSTEDNVEDSPTDFGYTDNEESKLVETTVAPKKQIVQEPKSEVKQEVKEDVKEIKAPPMVPGVQKFDKEKFLKSIQASRKQ